MSTQKNKTVYVTLKIEVPWSATRDDVELYTKEALANWGGGSDPEAVLFEGIKVLSVKRHHSKKQADNVTKTWVAEAEVNS